MRLSFTKDGWAHLYETRQCCTVNGLRSTRSMQTPTLSQHNTKPLLAERRLFVEPSAVGLGRPGMQFS